MNLNFKNEKKNHMEEEMCTLWESIWRYLMFKAYFVIQTNTETMYMYYCDWIMAIYINHQKHTSHVMIVMGTKDVLFGLA